MSARILVVEDEALIAEDLERLLVRFGYSVADVVDAGDAAIRAVAAGKVDIALMDITLRGPLDGIRTAQTLRDRWGTAVVFLTSHSDEATLARARAVVPHGYLLKPFSERDLRTTLEVVIAKVALERDLAAQERWFTATIDSLGEAVITADRDNRITHLNPVAERITGWMREQAIGRPLPEVFVRTPVDARPAPPGVDASLPARREACVVSRTGARRLVEDSATTIVHPSGDVLGSVVIARDVTEVRRAERRIAAAERSSSLGLLGSGVAHEINNPLTSMLMQLDAAQDAMRSLDRRAALVRELPPPVAEGMRGDLFELSDAITGATSAAARVVQIVAELRSLGRVPSESDRRFHLDTAVDRAVARCRIPATAQLRVHREPTPMVVGDEDDMVEVVGILLANAMDAVVARGVPGLVEVSTGVDEHGRAMVSCADDGVGVPIEDRERVFDPFFTTKDVGETLGFGLAKAHRTITAQGGEIVIAARPGGGTIASVVLRASS